MNPTPNHYNSFVIGPSDQVEFLKAIKKGDMKAALSMVPGDEVLADCVIEDEYDCDRSSPENFGTDLDNGFSPLWMVAVWACPKEHSLELFEYLAKKGIDFKSFSFGEFGVPNWRLSTDDFYSKNSEICLNSETILFLIEQNIELNQENIQSIMDTVFFAEDDVFWDALVRYAQRNPSEHYSFMSKTLNLLWLQEIDEDKDFIAAIKHKSQWMDYFYKGVKAKLPLIHIDAIHHSKSSLFLRVLENSSYYFSDVIKVLLNSGLDYNEPLDDSKSDTFFQTLLRINPDLAYELEKRQLKKAIPNEQNSTKKGSPKL